MKREDIVKAARKFNNISWSHEGRGTGGLDCIGLIQAVGDVFKIPYTDKKGYSQAPIGLDFLNHLRKYLTVNKGAIIKDGTIGVFRQGHYPCHVGIFATKDGQRTLIHSTLTYRKVVETTYVPNDGLHLVMTMEFPGVQD